MGLYLDTQACAAWFTGKMFSETAGQNLGSTESALKLEGSWASIRPDNGIKRFETKLEGAEVGKKCQHGNVSSLPFP